jgi:hypothetical protein
MSFKNQKSLVVVAGVIAALLAGTVLLGGYAKSVPAKSDTTNSQTKAKTGCPMTSAYLAENGEASCPHMAKAAFNAKACSAGRTEPCCAEDPPLDCCPKPCPLDCPKACCAKEAAASGCAGSAGATGACCPAATSTATK